MPVTYPVIERIARELYRRLDMLTLETSTAETRVSEVIRPRRLESYTPKHLQIVLTSGVSVILPELMCPGNPPAIARRQTFNCRLHLMPSEHDGEAIDDLAHRFVSDVVNAVVVDVNTWHTFGGLAVNAEWEDEELIFGDGGLDGCNLPISITYRTDEGNPYNVRA